MRFDKEEIFRVDELNLFEERETEEPVLKGVLTLSRQGDQDSMESVVNVLIGNSEIGFITVEDLVNVCQDIINQWGKKCDLESKTQ